MDSFSAIVGIIDLQIELAYIILRVGFDPLQRLLFYTKCYGPIGILLSFFGNSAVWKMQIQVLISDDPQTALDFKNARQKESDTVAVAVRSTFSIYIYLKLISEGFDFGPNCHHVFFIEQYQRNSLDRSRLYYI